MRMVSTRVTSSIAFILIKMINYLLKRFCVLSEHSPETAPGRLRSQAHDSWLKLPSIFHPGAPEHCTLYFLPSGPSSQANKHRRKHRELSGPHTCSDWCQRRENYTPHGKFLMNFLFLSVYCSGLKVMWMKSNNNGTNENSFYKEWIAIL